MGVPRYTGWNIGSGSRNSARRQARWSSSVVSTRKASLPATQVATAMPSRYSTRAPELARHLVAGEHGADEVQRIERGQAHQRAVVRALAHGAQGADRFGQRELLARQARDEASAADFAAGFEPVVDAQQLAPRRQPGGFAFEQAPARRRRSGAAGCARCVRRRFADRRACASRRLCGGSASSGPRLRCRTATRAARGARRRRCGRLDCGTSNARRPAKLSQCTRPRATSSASASSSSVRSRCAPVDEFVEERRAVSRADTRRPSPRARTAPDRRRCVARRPATTSPVACAAATRWAWRARARCGRPARPTVRCAGAPRSCGRRCTGRRARRSSNR